MWLFSHHPGFRVWLIGGQTENRGDFFLLIRENLWLKVAVFFRVFYEWIFNRKQVTMGFEARNFPNSNYSF